MERIDCRIEAKVSTEGTRATATGRCATVSGTTAISMAITRRPEGLYSARFSAGTAGESIDHSGREAGNQLVFDSIGPIGIDGKYYRSRVVLRFGDAGRFDMAQVLFPVRGGARHSVLDIRFSRWAGP